MNFKNVTSQLLQFLPDSEDSVDVRVVKEEDGVIGRILKSGHGVLVTSSDQVMDVVVGNFKLNLTTQLVLFTMLFEWTCFINMLQLWFSSKKTLYILCIGCQWYMRQRFFYSGMHQLDSSFILLLCKV